MTDTDKQEQPLKTEWDKEEELLLKEWAEKAICYKWLHTKSNKKYSKIVGYSVIEIRKYRVGLRSRRPDPRAKQRS